MGEACGRGPIDKQMPSRARPRPAPPSAPRGMSPPRGAAVEGSGMLTDRHEPSGPSSRHGHPREQGHGLRPTPRGSSNPRSGCAGTAPRSARADERASQHPRAPHERASTETIRALTSSRSTSSQRSQHKTMSTKQRRRGARPGARARRAEADPPDEPRARGAYPPAPLAVAPLDIVIFTHRGLSGRDDAHEPLLILGAEGGGYPPTPSFGAPLDIVKREGAPFLLLPSSRPRQRWRAVIRGRGRFGAHCSPPRIIAATWRAPR